MHVLKGAHALKHRLRSVATMTFGQAESSLGMGCVWGGLQGAGSSWCTAAKIDNKSYGICLLLTSTARTASNSKTGAKNTANTVAKKQQLALWRRLAITQQYTTCITVMTSICLHLAYWTTVQIQQRMQYKQPIRHQLLCSSMLKQPPHTPV